MKIVDKMFDSVFLPTYNAIATLKLVQKYSSVCVNNFANMLDATLVKPHSPGSNQWGYYGIKNDKEPKPEYYWNFFLNPVLRPQKQYLATKIVKWSRYFLKFLQL